MFIYKDILTSDELLSDAFPRTEILGGMIWEVESELVEVAEKPEINVSANPSMEMLRKEVQKLLRGSTSSNNQQQAVEMEWNIVNDFHLQEQERTLNKKEFVGYIKDYFKSIEPMLDEEKQRLLEYYKDKATRYLCNQLKDHLIFYAGKSYVAEEQEKVKTYVFSYYKEGKKEPTFLYLSVGLREEKA